MSRAYRIKVRESLRKLLRAHDRVQTELELLGILPAEEMAALLEKELQGRGFKKEDKALVRRQGGVTISVEPETGTVTLQGERQEDLDIKGEREGRGYEDQGKGRQGLQKQLQKELKEVLKKEAERRESDLQRKLADQLEAHLGDLQRELDQAVNRVTAEALKRKAAQLGTIKELTEDPEAGALTIVLEV